MLCEGWVYVIDLTLESASKTPNYTSTKYYTYCHMVFCVIVVTFFEWHFL